MAVHCDFKPDTTNSQPLKSKAIIIKFDERGECKDLTVGRVTKVIHTNKTTTTPLTLISWCSSLRDSARRSLTREACEGSAAAGAGVPTPFVVAMLSVSIMLAIEKQLLYD